MERSVPADSGRHEAGLHIFEGILEWLIGLFQLTEAEQRDAGISIGDPGDEERAFDE
jgi:hypothetical protein